MHPHSNSPSTIHQQIYTIVCLSIKLRGRKYGVCFSLDCFCTATNCYPIRTSTYLLMACSSSRVHLFDAPTCTYIVLFHTKSYRRRRSSSNKQGVIQCPHRLLGHSRHWASGGIAFLNQITYVLHLTIGLPAVVHAFDVGVGGFFLAYVVL